MTGPERSSEEPADALAREAAFWFARMRAPDAATSQGAFDAWLGQSPAHRVAYNRAAEIFSMGKLLAEPEPVVRTRRRNKILLPALALCAAGGLGLGTWALVRPSEPSPAPRDIADKGSDARRTISTRTGETRVARLSDGSVLRLAADTRVEIDLSAATRALTLVRGEARFEVAGEDRPFVVAAGGGSVTAHGTVFEVCLSQGGKVEVRLMRGSVDVALPLDPSAPGQAAVRRLRPGESLSFDRLPASSRDAAPHADQSSAEDPMHAAGDFTSIPISELVARANRGAAHPIRLADPALGAQRISGRFRIDDTELLARRLAALSKGRAESSRSGEIVVRRDRPVPE